MNSESTDSGVPLSDTRRPKTDSLTSEGSVGVEYVPNAVQLPAEEEKATGSIDSQVFITYTKAGAGIFYIVLTALTWVVAQTLLVGGDWWLARWTNQNEDRYYALKACNKSAVDHTMTTVTTMSSVLTIRETYIPDEDAHFNLHVYTGIICVMFASFLIRAFLFFMFAVSAGENLHNLMFARCLRATLAFFDTNSVGRVLNRFSKDMGQIDDVMPWVMFDFLQSSLATLGVVVASSVINPWVLIPVVPLVVLFVLLRRYYVHTSRSVKRLEGTTRSPVFSHVSATLQGLHTIRAMDMEQRLQAEFDLHQDLHSQAWFLFLTTSRWLGIRLDCLSAIFVAGVVYCSILAADTMDAGYVGLSVVYCINLMGMFQWSTRQSVELENQMVSVERVIQYTRLPIEADLETKPGQNPPDTWPTCGSLQARGVSLRYSPSQPTVLKDLHFHIEGGEKIGVVGRTGAGKSSLVTALFRLAEPEGELTIDGVNIHRLGLHDLRRVISIIPQDPVLFTGSVRRNLDPFDVYSDSQLWTALEEVQLKEAVTAHPDNLYMEVNEGGTNFSAGQRQLMCLARAVLGNTHILVIDEATANVDPITNGLIQQTIRNKFQTCTVLSIAHRLHTIIDSDRIMVLDAGRIIEMGTPAELLSRRDDGLFYSMVEQLGKGESEHLSHMAANTKLTHSSEKISPVHDTPQQLPPHSRSSAAATPGSAES